MGLRCEAVGEHKSGGAAGEWIDDGGGRLREMGGQETIGIVAGRRFPRGRSGDLRASGPEGIADGRSPFGLKNFAGIEPYKLGEGDGTVGDGAGQKLAGRHVKGGDAEAPGRRDDRRHKQVLAGRERAVVVDDAGADDADDLARDDPLAGRRIGHLLADRDREVLIEEPLDVICSGVVGDPRHRDFVGAPLRTRGQCEVEGAGRADGIVEEELVKVPHPEEQERVRIAPFCRVVLAEKGGFIANGRPVGGNCVLLRSHD
jgi:hypothetical protein